MCFGSVPGRLWRLPLLHGRLFPVSRVFQMDCSVISQNGFDIGQYEKRVTGAFFCILT